MPYLNFKSLTNSKHKCVTCTMVIQDKRKAEQKKLSWHLKNFAGDARMWEEPIQFILWILKDMEPNNLLYNKLKKNYSPQFFLSIWKVTEMAFGVWTHTWILKIIKPSLGQKSKLVFPRTCDANKKFHFQSWFALHKL